MAIVSDKLTKLVAGSRLCTFGITDKLGGLSDLRKVEE
jgi:hypothetical protein